MVNKIKSTTHAFTAEDATSLSALYWAPASCTVDSPAQDDPVLLVHGAGASISSWQFGGDASLAVHLAEKGYRVWSVELRQSSPHRPGNTAPLLEDYVQFDIPAAMQYILQFHHVTNGPGVLVEKGGIARKINFVGHALGGVIGLSLLVTAACTDLKSLVSLGGCASFEPPQSSMIPCLPAGGLEYVPQQAMDAKCELKLQLRANSAAAPNGASTTPACTDNANPAASDDAATALTSTTAALDATWVQHLANSHSQASLNDVPILMVVGAADQCCRPLYARRTMAYTAKYCYTQKMVVLGEDDNRGEYGGKAFGHCDYLSHEAELAAVVRPQITSWLKGPHSINPHKVGAKMLYVKNGVEKDAEVRAAHHDDFPNIYYTIVTDAGQNEKQTDHKNLIVIVEAKPEVAAAPGCIIA